MHTKITRQLTLKDFKVEYTIAESTQLGFPITRVRKNDGEWFERIGTFESAIAECLNNMGYFPEEKVA